MPRDTIKHPEDASEHVTPGATCEICGEAATRTGLLNVNGRMYPNEPLCEECGEMADEYEKDLLNEE